MIAGLITYTILMLLMLVAMMKFTASLMAKNRGTDGPVAWPARMPGWLEALRHAAPASVRDVSARRFWGVVYAGSFALAILVLFASGTPATFRNLLVVGLVSAGWWVVWGLVTWALLGFRRPRWGGRPR